MPGHGADEAPAPLWSYYKLWPNVAIEIYPDQIDFMQFVPVSPTETVLREIAYVHAGRPARDARGALPQLAHQPAREPRGQDADRARAGRHGLLSYTVGPLGEGEVCLRSFARRMRALFPEARQGEAPPKGWSINRKSPRPQ